MNFLSLLGKFNYNTMHEICRHYFDWKDRRFLIIIFLDDRKEEVRVFLQRQLIYRQTLKLPTGSHHNVTIESCVEWIRNKYR
jgi:hypothetical protein